MLGYSPQPSISNIPHQNKNLGPSKTGLQSSVSEAWPPTRAVPARAPTAAAQETSRGCADMPPAGAGAGGQWGKDDGGCWGGVRGQRGRVFLSKRTKNIFFP